MNTEQMDFDSEIEDEGQGKSHELPAGRYRFEVAQMIKATVSSGGRCEGCNMAVLELDIYAPDDDTLENKLATIKHENLVLHSSCEWKLCQFFRSIGEKKHSERFKPKWNEVQGAWGFCNVKQEPFTKRGGTVIQTNKIEEFLDRPDDEPPQADSAPSGIPDF